MATYNVLQARTNLSRLLQAATGGEEVVIAKAGEPLVRLAPIVKEDPKRRRKLGDNFLRYTYLAPDALDDLPLNMWEHLSDDTNISDEDGLAK